jgi:geranylgeranyl diphosphate synthase type I
VAQTITALPDAFSRYRTQLDDALRAAIGDQDHPLYDMLRYHMGWQDETGRAIDVGTGKGVRPALCLFACEAVGGSWKTALPAAVAIELIHNFSLIHDDIQDGDKERRHRPTVWYIWGHSHGMNAGVAMNVLANRVLAPNGSSSLPAEMALQVSSILTSACREMIEGQVLDLGFEQRSTVRVSDYLTMIGKKTGALLESSLHMGAVIGTDDSRFIKAMSAFGTEIGFMFQVRDDMLGIWGVQDKTGKPTGSDIHRRKKSLPIVHALETAEGSARERLLSIYRAHKPLTETDIADVISIMDELDTAGFCSSLAKEHGELGLQALSEAELGPKARAECEEMTAFLLERDY